MRPWLVLGVMLCACFTELDGSDGTAADTTTSEGTTTATMTSTTMVGTVEPTTDTSGEAPADSSSTDGCGGDAIELPPVPPGWEGPVVARAHDAGDADECPADLREARRGWLTAVPSSCDCACTDKLTELCALTIDISTSCNDRVGAAVASECVASGTSFTQVEVAASECDPEATLRVPDGATELVACVLPTTEPCTTLPPGFMGPCVIGAGECPAAFPNPIDTTAVACMGCEPCDTTPYCTTVTASSWTGAGCAGEQTALQLGPCNLTQTDASVSFQSPLTAVQCGEVDGVATPLRYCCA